MNRKLYVEIKQYIKDNYIEQDIYLVEETHQLDNVFLQSSLAQADQYKPSIKKQRSLDHIIDQVEESFSQRLLGLIEVV